MTVISPEFLEVSVGNYPPATAKLSAECNFRELDDAFLQTQTRIWLGEVLQIRLDEGTDISDILADGKLISELSEVLSMMLPRLSIDAHQSKTNELKSFVSSKSTSRYMPYYNVGSFLKMCKTLGLDGIDLFTPSDVVEKRNTRKVCICIRSLSKRARSRNLNVPDFDSVTCTLTMPTNKVEFIRKSLEMSQSSSSLSDVIEVDRVSSIKYKSRMSNSASTVTSVSNEYSSDICDDAESSFIVGEFNAPSDHTCDAESLNMPLSEVVGDCSSTLLLNLRDLETEEDDQCEYMSPSNGESVGSPSSQYFSDQDISMPSSDCLGSHISGKVDLNSEAKPKYQNGDLLHIPIKWEDVHLDFENHSDDRANNDEFNCLSLDKQDTYVCDACFENPAHSSEIESEKSSRSSIEQASCINSMALRGNTDVTYEFFLEDGFTSRVVPVPCLEDSNDTARDEQVMGEPFCDKKVKEDNLSNGLIVQRGSHVPKTTENVDFSGTSGNFVPLLSTEFLNVGENSYCDSLNNTNSAASELPGRMSILVQQSSCPVDSSTNCKSSSLPAVVSNGIDVPLISRFVDEIEAFGQLLLGSDTFVSGESDSSMARNDKETFDANKISLDHREEYSGHDVMDLTVSKSACTPQSKSSVTLELGQLTKDIKTCSQNSQEIRAIPDDHRPLSVSNSADALVQSSFSTAIDDPRPEVEASGCMEDLQCVEDTEKVNAINPFDVIEKTEHIKQEDATKDIPKHKPGKKLLKSVVKGTAATALLGIAVFLLHLRKSRQENVSRVSEQPVEVLKQSAPVPLSKKGQKGGKTSSVYPAEKLSFGF